MVKTSLASIVPPNVTDCAATEPIELKDALAAASAARASPAASNAEVCASAALLSAVVEFAVTPSAAFFKAMAKSISLFTLATLAA